jgi:hypothetical protein
VGVLAQQLGDHLIAVGGHVLIAQCGRRCAMTQPPHQLGQAGSGGDRTIVNSSNLPGACHYDAPAETNNPLVPKDTQRTIDVPANGKTDTDFPGTITGATYKVTITCKDASGKQTQDIGDVNLSVKW